MTDPRPTIGTSLKDPKSQVEATGRNPADLRAGAVYFDTNPILAAGWPSPSAQLLQLLNLAHDLGLPLCLPELVCKELEGHWVRDLLEEWEGANAQIDKLNRKARSIVEFPRLSLRPTVADLLVSVRKLVGDFTERFSIVPTTQRPLTEFLELAIAREATFEEGGKGFQDAVILYSVLDDVVRTGRKSAMLVSADKAFKKSGVVALATNLRVDLVIVSTLDELEGILRRYSSAKVIEYYVSEQKQLTEALQAHLTDIEAYLIQSFTMSPGQLGIWPPVTGIESLKVVRIENAHSTFVEEESTRPDTIKVSVDVRVRLELELAPWATMPTIELQRLRVGGVVTETVSPTSPLAVTLPEFLAKRREIIVVIEADAKKSNGGYSEFQFTRTYIKPNAEGGMWALVSRKAK